MVVFENRVYRCWIIVIISSMLLPISLSVVEWNTTTTARRILAFGCGVGLLCGSRIPQVRRWRSNIAQVSQNSVKGERIVPSSQLLQLFVFNFSLVEREL
mmetsp:Transcript_30861/g.64746  ORF Transcript_30861/g.64746 Transcript_30861/m.64746 type:complete len:100 (+) Transcript_30861:3049-3348(+)